MKLVATTLALSLIFCAPGIAPYQALAGVSRAPMGVSLGRTAPAAAGVNVALPALLPQVSVGVPAIQPATPTPLIGRDALPSVDQLSSELTDGKGPAEQRDSLERFWSNVKLDGPSGPELPSGPASEGAAAPSNPALQPAADQPKAGPSQPVSPETNPELFAPRSSRVGVGPAKYVYWNAFYKIAQWFNLNLARDPNRRVSWDKWPTKLGLLYLIGKIRYLRSGTLTDPTDYASNDVKPAGKEPDAAKKGYTADGSWVSDRENPRMGAENTRVGSNIPPKKVRPDVENMTPSAREAGKTKWRRIDENGNPIFQPALILNQIAALWIEFQFHSFGGNTKRDPIAENPHKMPRTPADNWPEKEALVDRTSKDATRVTDNGRPTVINERTQAWVQAQLYGTNEAEQKPLRSFKGGKMRLDEKGQLPEDPQQPGIDLTGFNRNYNPTLSFLHWSFVKNHNSIAEHLLKFNPTWDDETLFQYARKINVASMNQIHTTEWTEDLLQHPTLQEGMHAEFYGLFGPKLKARLMRLSFRHPWFAALIKPISNNDVIWGMPGSKWEHHDGPFQVPKQFRMVYRLHELLADMLEMLKPGSEERLARIQLIDFIQHNTRPIVEKFGYDVILFSAAKGQAGALKLHNFPRSMTQFKRQHDGQLIDLAELDLFRERTDGTGTYNEFRRSVGEPPVTSFMELTGGDAALAEELSAKYEGQVDKVDAGIGILAEPKPAGFALGFTQFYQFVLNAPRRVKSNRHLTEYFTHKDYTFEGMEWVLQSGGMGGVIARAMKDLPGGKDGSDVLASMEGVTRWFAPWPDTETFPLRMLERAAAASGKILKTNAVTLALGAATAVAGVLAGIASPVLAAALPIALAAPVLLYYKRMLAWRFMQKTWQSVYTDRRRSMFPTLFLGEKWAARSARLGRLAAKAVLIVGAVMAWTLMPTDPLVAGLFAATALSSLSTKKATGAYLNDMQVLRIALQNRMREGYTATTDASTVPGKTALERRYSVLIPPGSAQPVARIRYSYRVLHEQGLPKLHAFKTALLSHLIFGPRTQRGLGVKGRWKAGLLLRPFAIYIPNMVQAQGPSTTRIYAGAENKKGLTPGDVDLEEFDRMFSTYAPGRDYMTAYDFERMAEGNRWRAAREGVGGPIMRLLGGTAVKLRTQQLIQLYADRVANEDKLLVPAISRDMLLRVYQGTAQVDIMKERALDGAHPDLAAPKPFNPDAPVKKTVAFRAALRTLAKSLVLPLSRAALRADAQAFRACFSDVRKLGWTVLAAIVAYYVVRDVFLYVALPYLLLKGIL